MLVIFGIKKARIGNYIDNDHICYPCKSFEREIRVYRSYFHFCLIPVFPMGAKRFEIHGGFVSNLADDDYFVKEDTVVFRRKQLKQMLEKDEIYSVKRSYGAGFNRIK